MSTFIHGGSGIQLDVGAKAHAALRRGDVVAINPVITTAGNEGYVTMAVGDLNTAIQQVTMHGVVLGSNGKDSFAIDEDILVRICGIVEAKCINGTGVGDVLRLTASDDALTDAAAATGIAAQYAVGTRWVGVAHTANATGGDALCRVWFNGLGVWG